MKAYSYYNSPLGQILLTAEDDALTGLWFVGQKHFPEGISGEEFDTAEIAAAKLWLDRYFRGENPELPKIALRPQGTEFQKKVWQELLNIPRAQTTSYGAIAKKLEESHGTKTSARAVGGAVGRNPISIIIPCHRVLGADGSLTGYAGGTERKISLLKLEQVYIIK